MSRDKQIEEMAKDIFEHCNAGLFEDEAYEIARFVIEGQGYRKASDVAREIFEALEEYILLECNEEAYAELKKKYTEEGK